MKKNNQRLYHLLGLSLIILIVFRNLITSLQSNLIDWRDYAYITWVINQNITHLRLLDFANIFNQNAFYPYTNTIFLSDTLFTQSIIGLPFSFISKNPVAIFNSVFIITIFLNSLSSYIFWKNIFHNCTIGFVGSLACVFSPIFFTQLGHFQMLSYWPFFLSLHLAFKSNVFINKKVIFTLGVLLSIQFLASVYLAVFLGVTLFIYFLVHTLSQKKIRPILSFLIVILIFILLDSLFIKGYLNTKTQFQAQRDYREYVAYSAHLSDYLFPSQKGLIYLNPINTKWLSFNKHNVGESASFPGIAMSLGAILGIITISVKKKEILIKFVKSNNNFIFLTLILLGITFSLGPKLNVNGLYTGVPLPYAIFVKYVPIFEMVRGLSRWSFLFYIGLTYFFLSFLIKVNKKVEAFFTILLFLEIIPLNIPTKNDSYITNQDIKLANICSDTPTVVLEIPVTHFDTNGSITDGLSYITKRLLATNYNNCYLVNGYSGYDLPSIQNIKNNLIFSSIESDEKLFYKTIKNTGADLIVINTNNLNPDLYYNLIPTINKLSVKGQVKLLSDNIYKINK